MIKDFFSGISSYLTAIQMISKFKLWAYVIIPSLISVLLAAGIFFMAYQVADDIGAWLVQWYPWEWGESIIEKVAEVFGGLLVIVIGLIIFKQLVMIVSGPFMSPLSERVEKGLQGTIAPHSDTIKTVGYQLVRGLRIAFRNLWRELFFTGLLLILGLIPIFTPFTTIGVLLVQSYYFGFGNLDFALERHYGVRGTVQFVKKHKSLSIGNGLISALGLMTIVGFIFILPIGVVAATIETQKRLNKQNH